MGEQAGREESPLKHTRWWLSVVELELKFGSLGVVEDLRFIGRVRL